MNHKDYIVLNKILGYCKQVKEACNMFNNDFEKFTNISVFQNACCMCVLQIGELCKLISDELRNREKDVQWRSWCGIRDIFAHQYSNLDVASAWQTIQEDIPNLELQIRKILEK